MRKTFLFGLFGILLFVVVYLVAATRNQTTVTMALAKQKADKALQTKAGEYGLVCMFSQLGTCQKMILRAEKNPELKKALLHFQESGIYVFPESSLWPAAGSIGSGYVDISVWASDKRIIAFLTN